MILVQKNMSKTYHIQLVNLENIIPPKITTQKKQHLQET